MADKSRKSFLTYEQQITELIQHKKLSVNCVQTAKNMLKDVGYFALIGGYKEFLRNKETRIYYSGVNFEDIVALYEFDVELREAFFHYICKIEKKLRSIISYEFCLLHGEQQNEYLNRNNYNYSPKNSTPVTRKQINRLIDKLDELANISKKYPYIIHQRKKYGNVPLWVLVNAIEFGSLSKMYEFFKPPLQISISKNFNAVTNAELRKFLKFMVSFRNVCAHHERFFAYKSYCSIPNTLLHKKLNIASSDMVHAYGKNDVFAVLIVFKYLLPHNDFFKLKKDINSIINKFLRKNNIITKDKLYEYMGFPQNWERISLFRKLK